MIKNFLILILSFFILIDVAMAEAYTYEKREYNNHVLHIVVLKKNNLDAEIVKAKTRATVEELAQNNNAEIAINAGFFEIGDKVDGNPSGTLVINGFKHNLVDKDQPLILINKGDLKLVFQNPKTFTGPDISMVSAVPMLITHSQINSDLSGNKKDFNASAHARTAIGTKENGDIVIVVSEHVYKKDLYDITMSEVQSLIKTKGHEFARKYNHQSPNDITLVELKEILKNEYSDPNEVKGLTLPELAELMKSLGCSEAVNLDGGGSSTIWLGNKVVNRAFGDKDEENGLEKYRKVSDAIIFKKKTK